MKRHHLAYYITGLDGVHALYTYQIRRVPWSLLRYTTFLSRNHHPVAATPRQPTLPSVLSADVPRAHRNGALWPRRDVNVSVPAIILEDHPMTCKWLITMVIVSPLSRVIPLPNGRFMAYKWG